VPQSFYQRRGKRAFDLVVGAAALVLLAPVMLAVGVAVCLVLGRPALFRQVRPGLGGKLFTLCKFRTMLDARDARGNLLSDAERLTRFGRLLRATSLDELPELWNVVRGEMGLVGPRPLLPEYLERYTCEQARRHEVRPGVTGWAQIHGRNAVDWDRRLACDVWYVDRVSLWLDLKILAMTVLTVIKREGVSAEGHVTMPPFMGSASQSAEACERPAA